MLYVSFLIILCSCLKKYFKLELPHEMDLIVQKETQQGFIVTFELYSEPIKFAVTLNKELLRKTDLDRRLFYAIYTSLIILIVFI